MNEPSVLDYVKSKLRFWEKSRIHFPSAASGSEMHIEASVEPVVESFNDGKTSEVNPAFKSSRKAGFPWKAVASFLFALFGQSLLEPPARNKDLALALYVFGIGFLIWSLVTHEWAVQKIESHDVTTTALEKIRWKALLSGIILAVAAYFAFSKYTFDTLNIIFWLASLVCFISGFIDFQPLASYIETVKEKVKTGSWLIQMNWFSLLLLLSTAVILFFRVYQLNSLPLEMTSDHAEKLLDVQDVLNGQWHVFFTRNTGREAFQFYWTALIIQLFHTGLTFLSLKIGTMLAGMITLPYIYMIGKEFFNKRVAWIALILTGIAAWPNIISRVGLRFPLYPLFAAPALFYLLRGLKRGTRNDFIWAGISIGLGLHGYSPYRVIPILIIVITALFILHHRKPALLEHAITGLTVSGIIAAVVSIPLVRYAIDNPDAFMYRFSTRITDLERPLPGNPPVIFLDNLKNAMLMFGVNDGSTWLHSVPFRPALDTIGAALFYLGFIYVLYRYIRYHNWLDLTLILAVPMLMLPSILSLAFPEENPALNRTAAAIIPVFIIAAICLDALMDTLERVWKGRSGRIFAFLICALLVILSARQNYRIVFNDYAKNYQASSGNTTEMGKVIREFIDTIGTEDSAWVVGYPYWVDTRLVSINARVYPIRDYAIWPEQFETTRKTAAPKLFLFNKEDEADLMLIQSMYPDAIVSTYKSAVPGKDFLIMLVPSD